MVSGSKDVETKDVVGEAVTPAPSEGAPPAAGGDSDLFDHIRPYVDLVVNSRFTIPALVILIPLLVILLYPNVLFPDLYNVDEWLYISWARHFEYITERWYFTYYFVRFAYTFPGHVIHAVLPDFPARLIWGLSYNTLFLASVAGIFGRLFGRYVAVAGLIFVATDVVMLERMSSSYIDGPATAFLAAAMYCTIRAAQATRATVWPEGTDYQPFSLPNLRKVAPHLMWFFFAGLTFGFSVLTYFNPLSWALPLSLLFLLLWRPNYPLITVGIGLVIVGGLFAVLYHMGIFHHYTGAWDFWTAPVEFTKNPDSHPKLPFGDFLSGFLDGKWLHILPGTIVFFLSLSVCAHALVHKVRASHPAVALSLFYVIVIALLMVFQARGLVGITIPNFFTYSHLSVVCAAVAFAVYAREHFGAPARLLLVALSASFLVWWPLRLLRGPGESIWADAHSLTSDNVGLVLVVLGVAGVAGMVLIGRRPARALSYAATGFFAVLLLLATGFRAEDGWVTTKQGTLDARSQYELVTDAADELLRRFPSDRFVFAYSSFGDGKQGNLAWSLNSNFMFEYTQATRDWPNLNCARVKNARDYVIAGNVWVTDGRVAPPFIECGVMVDYVDSQVLQDGSNFLYLSFYRQAARGVQIASVTPDKIIGTNGGQLTAGANNRYSLVTPALQYAFSATIPLPELSGPVSLHVPIRATAGSLGVFITRAEGAPDFASEIPVQPGAQQEFIDIEVADAAQVRQIIIRNLVAQSGGAVIGPVEILRPASTSFVPAKGIRFSPVQPSAGVQAVNGGPSRFKLGPGAPKELATMDFVQDGSVSGPGTIRLRATTHGFYGRVAVVNKSGVEVATQPLPREAEDVLEIAVPALESAAKLVFSSQEDGARGQLRVETAVIFAASGR